MSNNPSNIVYLIGAGASRALSPDRVPDMSNFFGQTARLLLETCESNVDKKEIGKFFAPLAILEKYRVFAHRNPALEDIAARAIDDKGSPKADEAKLYAQEFLKDSRRCSENLEEVFLKAEIEGENSDPYERLGHLLQAVFVQLADEVVQDYMNPYRLLARLHSERQVPGTFISFNYDVWLERALQAENAFDIFMGYGGFLPKYITEGDYQKTLDVDFQSPQFVPANMPGRDLVKTGRSLCTVLKPHGSLSWIVFRNRLDGEPFVLTSNDGLYPLCSESPIRYLGGAGYIQPHVVAPGKAKRRAGGFFWKIDRAIVDALRMAHVLVVIGYRLPETDQEMADLFSFVTMRRMARRDGGQLQHLLICTKDTAEMSQDVEALRNRLSVIFRPEYSPTCHDAGFSEAFVDKLKNSNWTNVG